VVVEILVVSSMERIMKSKPLDISAIFDEETIILLCEKTEDRMLAIDEQITALCEESASRELDPREQMEIAFEVGELQHEAHLLASAYVNLKMVAVPNLHIFKIHRIHY